MQCLILPSMSNPGEYATARLKVLQRRVIKFPCPLGVCLLSGRKFPIRDERLSSNRNHLKIFGSDAGCAIGGAVVLGPQLLEVAEQTRGLPRGVERGECPVRKLAEALDVASAELVED